MAYRYDDDALGERRGLDWRSSMLRVALLFSSAGIAFALILTPLAERLLSDRYDSPYGIDYTSTSSISRSESYTVRRSVLQDKGAACIIRADGRRQGNC